MAVLGDRHAVVRTGRRHGRGAALASGPTQLRARADDAGGGGLATPRTPVSMKAWAMRPLAEGIGQRAHHGVLARLAGRRWSADISAPARGRSRQRCFQRRNGGRNELLSASSAGRAAGAARDVEAGETTRGGKLVTGCFLPDLAGLARRPSAASLPSGTISGCRRRGRGDASGRGSTSSASSDAGRHDDGRPDHGDSPKRG